MAYGGKKVEVGEIGEFGFWDEFFYCWLTDSGPKRVQYFIGNFDVVTGY